MEQEIRILPSEVELRETEDGKRSINGYAVKWEQLLRSWVIFSIPRKVC